MAQSIHIGSIIKETVDKKGLPVAEFARRMNMTRGGIKYIFDNQSINTDLLMQIGKILEYDFFQHFTSGGGVTTPAAGKAKRKVSVLIEVEEDGKQDKLLKLLGVTVK